MIGKVAQDAQIDAAPGRGFDCRREPFAGGIVRVRAHRIGPVVEYVDDEHRADGRLRERTQLDVARAAAHLQNHQVYFVDLPHEIFADLPDLACCRVDVVHVQYLDLADHHRVVGDGRKAATSA